jgi:hypothetical protein
MRAAVRTLKKMIKNEARVARAKIAAERVHTRATKIEQSLSEAYMKAKEDWETRVIALLISCCFLTSLLRSRAAARLKSAKEALDDANTRASAQSQSLEEKKKEVEDLRRQKEIDDVSGFF